MDNFLVSVSSAPRRLALRRLAVRLQRRSDFRENVNWTRDDVRDLVRAGLLTPDAADRWHRRLFKRPFVEPSNMGPAALRQEFWPLTLGVLWISYDGNEDAVGRAYEAFYDWGKGIWNARLRPGQVMTIAEADAVLRAETRRKEGIEVYEETGGEPQGIGLAAMNRLHQIEPWSAHILSYDGIKVAHRGAMVEAAKLKVRVWRSDGCSAPTGPERPVVFRTLVNIDASQTLYDNRSFSLNPTTVISAAPDSRDVDPDHEPRISAYGRVRTQEDNFHLLMAYLGWLCSLADTLTYPCNREEFERQMNKASGQKLDRELMRLMHRDKPHASKGRPRKTFGKHLNLAAELPNI